MGDGFGGLMGRIYSLIATHRGGEFVVVYGLEGDERVYIGVKGRTGDAEAEIPEW